MAKFSANFKFLKTKQGVLKILQTGFNIACVCLAATMVTQTIYITRIMLFYYLISVTFLISTALDLLSCCTSKSTAQHAIVSSHEVCVNLAAFVLYVSAGIAILVDACSGGWCSNHYYSHMPEGLAVMLAAGSMAIPNSILYLVSAIIALKEK